MSRAPSRADLGEALIAPLARVLDGARCIDARLSRSGGTLRVTVWPRGGEGAVRVVMPVEGLVSP